MKSLIIGGGEIGQGLYEATSTFHKTVLYDIKQGGLESNRYDIIHICIPGNIPEFVKTVQNYMRFINPKVCIVHSTVPPGTCRKIGNNVVHSPVRGKHPDMKKGIKVYTKYIGYNNTKAKNLALKFFAPTRINCKTIEKTETTEYAKIFSTTRYGLNLVFVELMGRICDKEGLSFKDMYQDWEVTYNSGLDKVGLSKFKRPILSRCGDKIGGHCVVENAHMLLDEMYPDFEADTVLAKLLSSIVQIGKGDRELNGF